MLVLTRKVQESILIGDDIRLTVTHISGNRVKLSIAAPDHVKIQRTELLPQQPLPLIARAARSEPAVNRAVGQIAH